MNRVAQYCERHRTYYKKCYCFGIKGIFGCVWCQWEKKWGKGNFRFCDIHLRPYLSTCNVCSLMRRLACDGRLREMKVKRIPQSIIDESQYKYNKYKTQKYNEALKESSKHTNETCSSCDKSLTFEEWFCYCSLCPDCYMQTPEEELEQLDKQIKEIANN